MNDIVYAGRHAITYSVSKHAHSSLELIYCTSGNGQITFDDNSILTYNSNNIAVIPPMLPHINESDDGFTNIFINIEDFSSSVGEPFVITHDDNGFIRNAFEAAYYYYSGSNSKRSDFLTLYGSLIAAFISSEKSSDTINSTVRSIEKYIIDHYQDPAFDLGGYLHSQPFSYDYLIKLFRKSYGQTPHKYLTSKRLQAAAAELATDRGRDISEIARASGFNDPLYFSRLFKKYYGISPKSYSLVNPRESNPDNMKIYVDS